MTLPAFTEKYIQPAMTTLARKKPEDYTDIEKEIIEALKALDGIKRRLQKLITNTTG